MEHPLPMGGQHWDGFDGVGLFGGALRPAFLPSRGREREGVDGRRGGGEEANMRLKECKGRKETTG